MHAVVDLRASAPAHIRDVRQVGRAVRLPSARGDPLDQERQGVVEELDRVEQRVGEAGLERLRAGQHPVLAERIRDDEVDGALSADEPRHQLRASPAGDDPEEDLGAGEMANARRDRPVVAVQRDLDAATEGRAVDGGERDVRERAERSEELVSGATGLAGALGGDAAELVDVGAGGEDERLSREQQALPAVVGQLGEDGLERLERLAAERVRLAPVGAVVHRHERDRPGCRVDALQAKARDGLTHSAGSPREALRPYPCRCRAR